MEITATAMEPQTAPPEQQSQQPDDAIERAVELLRHATPTESLRQTPVHSAMSPPLFGRNTPQASPRLPRSDLLRRSHSASSMSPPVSVAVRASELLTSIGPRALPPRDISDTTVDDAYINFIFYCNPEVPATSNTSELRRMFRSPPRSDGKCFNVFTLYQLIQKLNQKELRTWIQLAIELGVEPPSIEKKQSTQKVQQYVVRLKRWMRAMHVDAFFDYCLGNKHPYYLNNGSFHDQRSDGRDSIPKEEDLVLRTLVPEWRPRKNRKRVSNDPGILKRPRLDTHPDTGEASFTPWSAVPGESEKDNWGNNSVFGTEGQAGQQRDILGPTSGSRCGSQTPQRTSPFRYPHSAVIPRSRNQDHLFDREPRSAITAAAASKDPYGRRIDQSEFPTWAPPRTEPENQDGNNNFLGKDPGQPGVFNTSIASGYEPSPIVDPAARNLDRAGLETTASLAEELANTVPSNAAILRPMKLQLQVPEGSPRPPVRLATPQVVLNGEDRPISAPVEVRAHDKPTPRRDVQPPSSGYSHDARMVSLDNLAHTFSLEVQRARILGTPSTLGEKEATNITNAIIQQIQSECAPDCPPHMVSLHCAICMGMGHQLGLGGKRLGQLTINIIHENGLHRPRDMDTGIPTPSTALENLINGPSSVRCIITFDLILSSGVTTKTTIQVTLPALDKPSNMEPLHRHRSFEAFLTPFEDYEDDILLTEAGVDWKQRYLNLKKQLRKRESALRQYKKKLLEVVMDDI